MASAPSSPTASSASTSSNNSHSITSIGRPSRDQADQTLKQLLLGKLTDQSDRSGRTMTTSTTSLLSTSGNGPQHFNMSHEHLRQLNEEILPEEEKEEIKYDDDIMVASAPAMIPPRVAEEEFKPASIKPNPTRNKNRGNNNSSTINNSSKKKGSMTGSVNSNNSELMNSMALTDVFPESTSSPGDAAANKAAAAAISHHNSSSNTRVTTKTKNHNSSSSNNSDESSILLDVSWGSNNFDKSLLLTSFEDMLAVQDGHRIGGGRVGSRYRSNSLASGSHSNPARSDGGTSGITNPMMDSGGGSSRLGSGSYRSGTSSHDISDRSGSTGARSGSTWKKTNSNSLYQKNISEALDDGTTEGPGSMIPPVFKTMRRDSKESASNQQIVHVDGGGDGQDIGANLGFRNKETNNNNHRRASDASNGGKKSKPGLLGSRSSKSWVRRTSRGSHSTANSHSPGPISRRTSDASNNSTGGGGGGLFRRSSDASNNSSYNVFRRASNASNSSDTLTGFQVLTASFQSARQQSISTFARQQSAASMGNGGYAANPIFEGGDTGELENRQRMNNSFHPSVREDYTIEDSERVEEGHPVMVTTAGPPYLSRGSSIPGGMSMELSDSRRDDVIGDTEDHEGEQAGGRRKKDDEDNELVAEVGGMAYLRASRSVWAMRIIVVLTFIVVSVIVTVLTYTFFRDMESDTLNHNFIEVATNCLTTTTASLKRKASSTKALSKAYTGILGVQKGSGATRTMGNNHPPSVMVSPSTLACSEGLFGDDEDNDSNSWKTTWPNVTLPGHDAIVSAMLEVSHSQAAVFAPLLWEEDGDAAVVAEWEEYAVLHALPSVKDVVLNGIRHSDFHQDEEHQDILSRSSPTSSLRVPAWQIAPAELMKEGIMWDYYSHPPYKVAIDRILNWNKEGVMHDNHGRSMVTHDDMAAVWGAGPQVAATELIPCSEALLPLHLNPTMTIDPIVLSGDDYHAKEAHDHWQDKEHDVHASDAAASGFCSAIFYPVYDGSPSGSNGMASISGVVTEMFSWSDIFTNTVQGHGGGIHEVRMIIESRLKLPDGSHRSQAATYIVNDFGAELIGPGRHLDTTHQVMVESYEYSFPNDDVTYAFEVYPNDNLLCFKNGVSKQPMFLSIIAACFFFLSVLVFFVYDYFVNHRQKVVVRSAAHSARIVHSLYPQFVRENLFGSKRNNGVLTAAEAANTNSTQEYDEEDPRMITASGVSGQKRKGLKSKVSDFVDTPATQLKRFLTHPMPSREYDYNLCMEIGEMEPIAEVFEKTTVMLADIEGFTAWCSEREPSQVFRLLETVYREFDIEARKLGVFKVETVGDCYVAVTGLPDPRDDHAIVIAKYAVRCLLKFNVLTKRLEANLGPGTAALGMRFGLHSGPVTAGVLRGEKSRFQLFGDTINVASRMESTGEKNMIQVSQDTADLLNASGKGHWLTSRDGPVSAKGKGSIQTYWLQPNRRRPSMHGSLRQSMGVDSASVESVPTVSLDRALRQSWKCIGIDNDSLVAKERLIRWNAAILESFLLKIVDNRNAHSPEDTLLNQFTPSQNDKVLSFSEKLSDKVMFPDVAYRDDYYGVSNDVSISSEAQIELLEYVAMIASMYRDVPFHNFDHASHVTMSANKLLNRVCTTFEDEEEDIASVAARTFGISADPLAQFVVVFSSLVHDVDHQGVPNAQLVKEDDPLAAKFDNRSVAEKRSITVAWDILMEDRFRGLQSLIFVNGDEMRRFKQLLINTVLATDIADKERSALGKIRWQKAFHPSLSTRTGTNLDESATSRLDDTSLRSLKATLVFEQIMQASDVAHTMQHWETFKKWNRRLYRELSKGYREGRGASDPRDNWYGGEIGFFDFYIIPLAKKLKECGVFGSAASEYLDYALENRRRWEDEGHEIARKMIMENDAPAAEEPAEIITDPASIRASLLEDADAPAQAVKSRPQNEVASPKDDAPEQSGPKQEEAPKDDPGEMV